MVFTSERISKLPNLTGVIDSTICPKTKQQANEKITTIKPALIFTPQTYAKSNAV